MTEKDYELIAKVFGEERRSLLRYSGCLPADENHRDRIRVNAGIMKVVELANVMADELERQDPKFDEVRFRQICGNYPPVYVNSKGETVRYED
jgi:hypothetical protein